MLRGKFWDALPLLGHFQKGRHKKYEKLKMGYSIPQLLIITDTQTLSLNMCFLRVQNRLNLFKSCFLIT